MVEVESKTGLEAILESIVRRVVHEEIQAALSNGSTGNGHGDDRLLCAEEAAPILGYSKDWLYHHWKKLPFARKIGPKGLRFSHQGIQKYIASKKA
jgi:predicted DNA-binding transcriptional regulator AlpA